MLVLWPFSPIHQSGHEEARIELRHPNGTFFGDDGYIEVRATVGPRQLQRLGVPYSMYRFSIIYLKYTSKSCWRRYPNQHRSAREQRTMHSQSVIFSSVQVPVVFLAGPRILAQDPETWDIGLCALPSSSPKLTGYRRNGDYAALKRRGREAAWFGRGIRMSLRIPRPFGNEFGGEWPKHPFQLP